MRRFSPLQPITLTPEQAAAFEEALANPEARPTRPPQDLPEAAYSGANWLLSVEPQPIVSPYYKGPGCRCCKGERPCRCCGWPDPVDTLSTPEDVL